MNDSSRNWFISYKVPKVTGNKLQIAGPYSKYEVDDQYYDIIGFWGVTEAKMYQEDVDKVFDEAVDANR